jgi:hypothetical protein
MVSEGVTAHAALAPGEGVVLGVADGLMVVEGLVEELPQPKATPSPAPLRVFNACRRPKFFILASSSLLSLLFRP